MTLPNNSIALIANNDNVIDDTINTYDIEVVVLSDLPFCITNNYTKWQSLCQTTNGSQNLINWKRFYTTSFSFISFMCS